MAFKDYSVTPASNTTIGSGTFVGPNMPRNNVRPAIQQLAADGRALSNEVQERVNLAKGDPGSPGEGYATRVALAAVLATNLDDAYLIEAGRGGKFVFSTANLSAKVTADPFQGLYVAPTSAPTGTSGAWVRQVEGNTYLASWWGVVAGGTGVDVNAQSALDLIKDLIEPRLIMPPGTMNTSGGILARGSVHIEGYGCTLYRTGAYTQLFITASNSSVRGLGFDGAPLPWVFSGQHRCIFVSREPVSGQVAPIIQIENVTVEDCHFTNAPLAIWFFGDINGGVIHPFRKGKIRNNIIHTNYQGISVFCADDVEVSGNTISYDPQTVNGFLAATRILGSERCNYHDNVVNGPGLADTKYSGVLLNDAAMSSPATGGIPRANRDVSIINNKIYNISNGIKVIDCKGVCRVSRNLFSNALSNTAATYGLLVEVAGTGKIEVLLVKDNEFRGFLRQGTILGDINKVVVENNDFLSNASAGADTFSLPGLGIVKKLVRIVGNNFLLPPTAMFSRIAITGSNTGELFEIYENAFPEADNTLIAVQAGGGDSGGLVITTRGGPAIALSAGDPAPGSNYKNRAGLYAGQAA